MFPLKQLFLASLFSGKTSLAVRNSYLLTFPDDKADNLAVCPSKSLEGQMCFDFLTNTHFIISSS